MAAECANPLYLQWIKEWLDLAKERNSKGVTTYKKAYDSMKACPLLFSHPSEAQQLFGLGPKLCDRLTDKLKEHCTANGLPMPELPHKRRKRPSLNESEAAAPAKKPRKAKPYVPALRSGPYALILALSTISEDSTAGLTKAQTIEEAQPLCDSSFTAPSDPTKFYTAWNSMKTLIEKDLVYERGRPLRKYALTDEGWAVAKRIKRVAGAEDKIVDKPTEPVEPGRPGPFVNLIDESDGADTLTESTSHKVPTRIADIERMDASIDHGHRLGGNLNDKFGVLEAAKERKTRRSKADAHEFLELSSTPPPSPPVATKGTVVQPGTLPDTNKHAHPPTTNAPPNNEPSNIPHSDKLELTTFQPIRLNPDTFTVELVLDNREIRAKTDRDYIQDELRKKGVNPIMRSLELGDALWVAKCTDPAMLSTHGEEGDEVVLDWIVERKRLDDLVGSIKDGRFHEQKFRLRKSGLGNVIYIIEEIALSTETTTKYGAAIDSAIASTQVVNGYFVKRTRKLDDTIRYLARMTHMLKARYEPRPLALVPSAAVSVGTYLPLLAHLRATAAAEEEFHVSYRTFAALVSKSDSLTLRDVFLKMLMCTRGVTGERALSIQRRWGTPRGLVEALEGCVGEEGKRRMVSGELGRVLGRGKVGAALGAKVADVWGGDGGV